MRAVLRPVWRAVQLCLAALVLIWVALSLHFQVAAPAVHAAHAVLFGWGVALVVLAWRGRWARLRALTAVLLAFWAIWWTGIEPRQDRAWMAEVSRGVTSSRSDGETVIVRNIRDFRWSDPDEAVESWYDLEVDPRQIQSVDVILSTWDSPDIAHTLVSFGFEDGRHIVFSAESRKEEGEAFSSIGGFFKRYELVLIAADERDIVHLRTDVREESVSLYPVVMPAEQRIRLFEAFLDYGNDLAERPRWYHTLWSNCTTMPFRLVRGITQGVPLDLRVVLSGRLPGYLYDLGVLPDAGRSSLADLIARAALPHRPVAGLESAEYSHLLREGWRR